MSPECVIVAADVVETGNVELELAVTHAPLAYKVAELEIPNPIYINVNN
jgi:hypothetical protein